MKIHGLHLLLTYQCTFECDHCFVWGSPGQTGVMSGRFVRRALQQAKDAGTISSIYFEGGEPFLYYATLLDGVTAAAEMGFEVGIVSNAYWAVDEEDALACLRPFAGRLHQLSLSSDRFHSDDPKSLQVPAAAAAARRLGIPVGVMTIDEEADLLTGQLPLGESGVMYRGRAAEKLAPTAPRQPGRTFDHCPHEDLRNIGRVHLDPLGFVHLCQGVTIGNINQASLAEICDAYVPDSHPIAGPLLSGGPAALAAACGMDLDAGYADACHLCYEARLRLRSRFPAELGPNQMYGVSAP